MSNQSLHAPVTANSIGAITASEWLQNGIFDKAESTLAFVDGSRVFTINRTGASFDYFVQGVKYTVTTDDVAGVNTVTLTDTEGIWVIYYDGATLTALNSPSHSQFESVIMTKCIVAIVYYDATNNKGILYEERHGFGMSPWTHRYLHETVGFAYQSGLGLGDFVISDGADDEDAQFSIAAGECYDEDNAISFNAINSTTAVNVFYRDGTNWRWRKQTGFKCITYDGTSSTRLAYDNAGTLTEVSNRDFVLVHPVTTTDYGRDPSVILGQAEYATRSAARDGAETEISNLLLGGLPSAEMKPIGSVIFQTSDSYANAVKARVIETDSGDNYIDWRGSTLAQGVAAADHGSLGGLSDNDHPQYSLAIGDNYGFVVGYSNTTTASISAGVYECSGTLFSLASADTHSMTSLASALDHHYIYLDYSASLGTPTAPTFYDATTEPVFSISKKGWYHPINTDDRSLGSLPSKIGSSALITSKSIQVGNLILVDVARDELPMASAMNPDGLWQTPNVNDGSVVTPVNAVRIILHVGNTESDPTVRNVALYASSAEHAAIEGLGGTQAIAGGWAILSTELEFNLGASRNIKIAGLDHNDNAMGADCFEYYYSR